MARTFQDRNLLVWRVFATTGRHGFAENPNIVFQCISVPASRPRTVALMGNEAEAQARVMNATDTELLHMLESSAELS